MSKLGMGWEDKGENRTQRIQQMVYLRVEELEGVQGVQVVVQHEPSA